MIEEIVSNCCYSANNSRLGHRLSGDNRLSLEIILQARRKRIEGTMNQRVPCDLC